MTGLGKEERSDPVPRRYRGRLTFEYGQVDRRMIGEERCHG
jgi:hypothetical protein